MFFCKVHCAFVYAYFFVRCNVLFVYVLCFCKVPRVRKEKSTINKLFIIIKFEFLLRLHYQRPERRIFEKGIKLRDLDIKFILKNLPRKPV